MTPDVPTAVPGSSLRRRVLIVDDNADIVDMMRHILVLLGQEVRVAADGPAALRVAAEFRPDLVFLDLGLPLIDGYEVARRLRSEPGGSALQLIALSGWGDAESRERSTAAGFDQHWLKPIAMAELASFFAAPP